MMSLQVIKFHNLIFLSIKKKASKEMIVEVYLSSFRSSTKIMVVNIKHLKWKFFTIGSFRVKSTILTFIECQLIKNLCCY